MENYKNTYFKGQPAITFDQIYELSDNNGRFERYALQENAYKRSISLRQSTTNRRNELFKRTLISEAVWTISHSNYSASSRAQWLAS